MVPARAFPLPTFEAWRDEDLRAFRLPPRRLRCHPHLAVANGLDVEHYRTVHQLDFLTPPVVDEPEPHRVRIRLALRLRPEGAAARGLRLLAGETFEATFTTWGASMATIEGRAGRVPLLVLFTHRLDGEGGSASQTFFFQPRRRGRARALASPAMALVQILMGYVLSGDRHVLERVQFRPALVAADAPLAAFIRAGERDAAVPGAADNPRIGPMPALAGIALLSSLGALPQPAAPADGPGPRCEWSARWRQLTIPPFGPEARLVGPERRKGRIRAPQPKQRHEIDGRLTLQVAIDAKGRTVDAHVIERPLVIPAWPELEESVLAGRAEAQMEAGHGGRRAGAGVHGPARPGRLSRLVE